MTKILEFFIAIRYTRTKRSNTFISFISLISVLGIAVGVWALITVMSVMNGFEKELRDRILGVASHITISGYGERMDDWQTVRDRILTTDKFDSKKVEGVAPFIMGQGMIVNGKQVSGALIRGVDPTLENDVSEVLSKIKFGEASALQPGEYNIVIGITLAQQLGVGVGDKITVVSPQGQVTPAGLLPRLKRFTVGGLFKIGMHEYDSGLVLINIDDAAKLFRTGNGIDGLRLKLDDVFEAPKLGRAILDDLGFGYQMVDWTTANASFFNALKVEKRMMFIILFVIILVAAFNIVSTMVMVVTDKQSDIAIMRTLGLTPNRVMRIFIIQGTLIGVIGTIFGIIFGVLTALNISEIIGFIEGIFQTEFMPADLYMVSGFPSDLRWPDVIKTCIGAFLVSILATLYPARQAAKTNPAEALRHE